MMLKYTSKNYFMKKIIGVLFLCLLLNNNIFALPPSLNISGAVNLTGIIFNCTINSGGIATLTGNYSVANTLTVNSGGILNLNNFTLAAGAVIINNGGIIYEAGNTSGTSKLTSTAGIVYNRTQGHTDYSYISSPFVSSTGAAGYYYDETSRTDGDNTTGWKSASTNFTVGKGYAISSLGTKTITASAGVKLTWANTNVAITNTNIDATSTKNGWNLLGNPFAAPMLVSAMLSTNSLAAVYIWNGTNYSTLNSGNLPSGQGFFMHTNASTTFSFNIADVSTTNTNTLLRTNAVEQISLALKGENTDVTQIDFSNESNVSDNFDALKDAFKKFTSTASEIFTTAENTALAINSLNNTGDEKNIPVGISIAKEGTYELSAINNSAYANLILKDKMTGTETDISKAAYVFTAAPGNTSDRFTLQLPAQRVAGVDNFSSSNNKVYANDNQTIIVNTAVDQLSITDLTGNNIYTGAATNIKVKKSGIYLVETIKAGQKQVYKIMVK
jgi:hypothetical protein